MTSLGIIRALGAVAATLALFLVAWGWAARQRRRRIARTPGRAEPGLAEGEAAHRLELRLAALERGQGDLSARLEGAGGAEERLQATAGQLLGLVRDKNATIETALAGLDQLRGRMRVLEQIGDAAEARGLFERLGERLAAVEGAQAAAGARDEDGAAQTALVEELRRLHAQKDAAVEAVLGRLGPLEARLARVEGEAPAEALLRLEARVEALRDAQGADQAALAALRAETAAAAATAAATAPAAEIAERLARLHAQKDAGIERLVGRLAALEAELAARDPAPALDALGLRLEALRERVGLLETPAEPPFAAVSEQLTRLYAQKDAATEAVLARLAPVEARLEALGREVSASDPAVERLAAAVEEVRLAQAGVVGRLAALEVTEEHPFAAVSEQLTRLYAQKDAATEVVLRRLGEVEAQAAGAAAAGEGLAALGQRVGALEAPDGPLAAVAAELAQLQAATDAAVAASVARLAPVEAGLAALGAALEAGDPAVARLAQGIEEAKGAQAQAAVRLGERLSALERAAGDARAEGRAAEDAARAAAQAVAEELIALRAAAAETEVFADRLALLEASLPRLSAAQAEMMQALERQAVAPPAVPAAEEAAADGPDPLAALRDLPVVSLHRR